MNLLSIDGLAYAWPGQSPVVGIDHFSMAPGERVFLHGPSGSGKSTLLGLIGGLLVPDSGSLRFLETGLNRLSRPQRDRFRADHMGVIFQQFNLLPYLSVLDNVLLPCRFSRARAQKAGDGVLAAKRLLMAMDLDGDLWTRRADALSVGQQQRVAAARALIGQPELVIADEPTSALDTDRRANFLALLFEQMAATGSALLFVSHDRSLADAFDRSVSLDAINHPAGPEAAA